MSTSITILTVIILLILVCYGIFEMNLKYIHHILLIFLVLPFLLANEKCERSTTWGNKYFSKWESDHVDIDKETRCIDCHDDITSQKVKPKNHLDTVRWMG